MIALRGVRAGGNRQVAVRLTLGLSHCECCSDFRVEIEKRVETLPELLLNFNARAFDDVHGHVGFVAVGQLEVCVMNLGDFALGEQTESVD